MTKILLLNPNKWGRGITTIWVASHSSILKQSQHQVKLFDCTFYKDWTENEVDFNTKNNQYVPTEYHNLIKYNDSSIYEDLQKMINSFQPDIIFWSALSSHIHAEGEYVNIQYGSELLKKITSDALLIAGGLQPTANPYDMFKKFPNVDYFIGGESEFVLRDFANNIHTKNSYLTNGLIRKSENAIIINPPQKIISEMDEIGPYDYSIFDEQTFLRPYHGNVLRAVDYEMSRGCVYACSYCVETTIQKYYGFNGVTSSGTLKNASKYLRNKSSQRIFQELKELDEVYNIELIRCQDTNFLTIDNTVLNELSELIEESNLKIKLYIETRPEGITKSSIKLLQKLHVVGVGMGVEVSSEQFRKDDLNRFSSQEKIIDAFKLLKEAKISRTAYNIIGLPNETEEMILDTIKLNNLLDPDDITVAFYSPYLGTSSQLLSKENGDFDNYEFNVDGQIRTVAKSKLISKKILEFYKQNFVQLVKNGLDNLSELKQHYEY